MHAGGLDVIYPAENSELTKSILQKGARISEQPIGFHPTARFFPKRNRLNSGLCQAVVIVEAAAAAAAAAHLSPQGKRSSKGARFWLCLAIPWMRAPPGAMY